MADRVSSAAWTGRVVIDHELIDLPGWAAFRSRRRIQEQLATLRDRVIVLAAAQSGMAAMIAALAGKAADIKIENADDWAVPVTAEKVLADWDRCAPRSPSEKSVPEKRRFVVGYDFGRGPDRSLVTPVDLRERQKFVRDDFV